MQPDPRLNAFLLKALEDAGAGGLRPVTEYQEAWPGLETLIADEYARLSGDDPSTFRIDDQTRPDPAPVQERVGSYRIVDVLGRGGQGVVYLAEDERLGRRVALKVLQAGPLSHEELQRFRREATIASRLDHPSICPVYDTGIDGGRPWIAMRYVEGETLAGRTSRARAGPIAEVDVLETVRLVEEAALALHSAHEVGVVHRDVKPGNIIVGDDGRPVLLDFGLARQRSADLPTLTRSGAQFGTPAYMSPEQLGADPDAVDRRTDVWALGVTLYECVAHQRPFERPTMAALAECILNREPAPLSSVAPVSMPRDLDVVAATALDKDPARRYGTALAFAEDLRRVREHRPVSARPAGPILRVRRWTRRNRLVAASLSAFVIALVGGIVVSLLELKEIRRLDREREPARIAGLLSMARDLWPRRMDVVPRMESWLSQADVALGRRDAHSDRAVLDALDSLARAVQDVEARRRFARMLDDRLRGADRAAWAACVHDVANHSAYGGLRLTPIPGFVPLGRAVSGLWEFWHIGSGERPDWEDSRAAATEDSGLVFVLLPGGSFHMGAQPDERALPNYDPAYDEAAETFPAEPVHAVELDPFLMSKWEMTQGQWERCAGENPATWQRSSPFASRAGRALDLTHPLESVSWTEASTLLWRMGLILPTEAQWEFACRGGEGLPFHTGRAPGTLQTYANVRGQEFDVTPGARTAPFRDGFVATAPVGTFKPNRFGLHDMHGNVAEWCRDKYRPYDGGPPNRRDGLRDGPPPDSDNAAFGYRIYRGGSFAHGPYRCRTAYRGAHTPRAFDDTTGVRPSAALER